MPTIPDRLEAFKHPHLPVLPPTKRPATGFALQHRADPDFVAIPSTYGSQHSSLAPGAIVGITLGAVAGFLLVLFLLYSALGFGPMIMPFGARGGVVGDDGDSTTAYSRSVVSFRSRSRAPPVVINKHPSRRQRPVRVSATYQERDHERVPMAMPPPSPRRSSQRPPRVVPQDDESSDDEVVVIEEHSPPPPPRRQSRRENRSRYSDDGRRNSGYRDVDPSRFAGGDAPMRDVRSQSRRQSGRG